MERGFFTRNEILTQPEAWQDALQVVRAAQPALADLLRQDYNQVLFTGCGSTYYLSLAAAALFQELTGRLARATPGGELLLEPATALAKASAQPNRTLLVAVSRSGSTTETVRAVEQFKKLSCGPVIAITNYGDQPLAGLADLALVIEKGQEESVAQTRSFASMFVAANALAAIAAGDEGLLADLEKLPAIGQRLIAQYEPVARRLGENLDLDRFYFLGSGWRYGLACEVNLKMKEMTLTHSEPFHFLEFRHGPMSMATPGAAIVGFLSDDNYSYQKAVLDEMQDKGSLIIALSEDRSEIALNSHLLESARGVLYLPVLQLMAYYRSLAKGLDPDRPRNLTAVVSFI